MLLFIGRFHVPSVTFMPIAADTGDVKMKRTITREKSMTLIVEIIQQIPLIIKKGSHSTRLPAVISSV